MEREGSEGTERGRALPRRLVGGNRSHQYGGGPLDDAQPTAGDPMELSIGTPTSPLSFDGSDGPLRWVDRSPNQAEGSGPPAHSARGPEEPEGALDDDVKPAARPDSNRVRRNQGAIAGERQPLSQARPSQRTEEEYSFSYSDHIALRWRIFHVTMAPGAILQGSDLAKSLMMFDKNGITVGNLIDLTYQSLQKSQGAALVGGPCGLASSVGHHMVGHLPAGPSTHTKHAAHVLQSVCSWYAENSGEFDRNLPTAALEQLLHNAELGAQTNAHRFASQTAAQEAIGSFVDIVNIAANSQETITKMWLAATWHAMRKAMEIHSSAANVYPSPDMKACMFLVAFAGAQLASVYAEYAIASMPRS